jgi:hypothetical protein
MGFYYRVSECRWELSPSTVFDMFSNSSRQLYKPWLDNGITIGITITFDNGMTINYREAGGIK